MRNHLITWKKMTFKAIPLFILLFFSLQLHASEEKLFCATYYAFQYKTEIEKLPNDKTMHCTMSCYLAVKCPRSEAYLIGYLKEFWDIIGPGDADWNDIEANEAGIRFASKRSKTYCKKACLKRYFKNSKRK